MLAVYTMMVNISSLFALFIGMFIIYNSFAIAVTQRRSEIGILRALGATRGRFGLFLGESAVTGLIGRSAGSVLGVLIARGDAASICATFSRTSTGSLSTPMRCRPVPGCWPRAESDRDEHDRGLAPGAQGGARRSGAGAAEGQVQLLTAGENRVPRRVAGALFELRSLCLGSSRRSVFTPVTSRHLAGCC